MSTNASLYNIEGETETQLTLEPRVESDFTLSSLNNIHHPTVNITLFLHHYYTAILPQLTAESGLTYF